MKFLRNLLDDLWEKRLWPIALALVAALVAVPLLLAKSGPSTSASSAPATVTPSVSGLASSTPAVDIAQPDNDKRLNHLAKHNPFVQLHVPKTTAAKDTTSQAATGTGTSTGSGGTGTGTGTGTGVGTGGAGVTPILPKPTFNLASLDIRFGKADSRQERRNLPRLAPLPSPGNAVLIYLGLLKDGKTAVFLISSNAHAEGDGSCHPKASNCETVHLKAGDTEFFDVTTSSGAIDQYELDLLHVKLTKTTDAKAAAASYARSSKSGKTALRKFLRTNGSAFVGNLRYDAKLGHLVTFKAPSKVWGKVGFGESDPAKAGAALSPAAASPQAVATKAQP